MQAVFLPPARAADSAGKRSPARIAMTAATISISNSVKFLFITPRFRFQVVYHFFLINTRRNFRFSSKKSLTIEFRISVRQKGVILTAHILGLDSSDPRLTNTGFRGIFPDQMRVGRPGANNKG